MTPTGLDVDVILAANPSPFTGAGTQTYVLGRGEVAVIDPGPRLETHLDAVQRAVDARGRAALVLLTHHHEDHVEAAEEMARRLDAPIAAIPHPEAPRLDRALAGGERMEVGGATIEVLATPGHCRDHACFAWEQARAVFAGDLVAGEGFIVIDPPDGDMADYLDSLRLVRDHRFGEAPAAMLLPAHGPAIDDPAAYLDGYIAHRLAREAKVFAALPDGEPTPPESLLPVVYDDTPQAMHPIAFRSLLAHLDKLVRDGRAVREDGGYRRRA